MQKQKPALISIAEADIDVASLIAYVSSPAVGALSVFLGTVRDNNDGRAVSGISYHAYDTMALEELRRIASETETSFNGVTLAVVHRVGSLNVGDISVAIVASHARRIHAIEAARSVIEAIKLRLPVWKHEHYVNGDSVWVDPTKS